jgi:hypothetical protein
MVGSSRFCPASLDNSQLVQNLHIPHMMPEYHIEQEGVCLKLVKRFYA